jgi:hypothetical protein
MAMRKTILIAIPLLLTACGSGSDTDASPAASASTASSTAASTAPPALPDLAKCPAAKPADELARTKPLVLPKDAAGLYAADRDRIAVSTMDGGTVCADTAWIEQIENAKVSPDKRFIAFDWMGYESFGHIIVDRAAKGQVLETGNAPLAPPTGRRFASIDLSESAFGALNAFAVWDIESTGLREIAKFSEGLPAGDWKIGEWSGDSCVGLSVLPVERQPSDAADFERAERDRWYASAANGWKPEAGTCG